MRLMKRGLIGRIHETKLKQYKQVRIIMFLIYVDDEKTDQHNDNSSGEWNLIWYDSTQVPVNNISVQITRSPYLQHLYTSR